MKNKTLFVLLENASSGAGQAVDLDNALVTHQQITSTTSSDFVSDGSQCDYVIEWSQTDPVNGPWESIMSDVCVSSSNQNSTFGFNVDPPYAFYKFVRARIITPPSVGTITVKFYVE